jgi:hypothetical protein
MAKAMPNILFFNNINYYDSFGAYPPPFIKTMCINKTIGCIKKRRKFISIKPSPLQNLELAI